MNYLKTLIAESQLREDHEDFRARVNNLILNIQHIASEYPEYLDNIEETVNQCITVISHEDFAINN